MVNFFPKIPKIPPPRYSDDQYEPPSGYFYLGIVVFLVVCICVPEVIKHCIDCVRQVRAQSDLDHDEEAAPLVSDGNNDVEMRQLSQ